MRINIHTAQNKGGEVAETIFESAYLYEHVMQDENHVYDLSSHDKDMETAGWLVQSHSLQIADELECSYDISRNKFL